MNKLIALLLAVLLITSVSITAFAEETAEEPAIEVMGGQSADVTINITDENGNPLNPTPVYRVVITWKDLDFKVQATAVHWNPIGQTYWLEDGELPPDQYGYVTVTNHSNAPITVGASFEGAADETPLVSKTTGGVTATMELTTGALTNGELVVDSAEGYGNNPPYIQYTVTPGGTPQNVPDLEYTVDKIILTIEK